MAVHVAWLVQETQFKTRAKACKMTEDPTNLVDKNVALMIAAMSSFITPFTASSVNIALPSIGSELLLNALQLSWVATAYLLAAAILLVPFGRIADIYGRKRIFLFGMTVDAAASILCALSHSGNWLIVFRAMQGLGGAMIFGTGIAILTSVFPAKGRGRALGINVAAVYTGLSAGPLIGGVLTERLGWRSIFVLNALLGLMVIVAVLWKLRAEWAGAKGEKFDYRGAIIYSLAMVTIMYGFALLPDLKGGGLILVGICGVAAFVRWELKIEQPVLSIGLFRDNTVFRFSNLAALINYSATFAVTFLLSLYLQYIKGLTPERAGLILVIQPIFQIICSPVAGNLSDRIEPRILASAGMAATVTGLVLLTFVSSSTSLVFIIFTLAILGFGFGLFSSPNINAIMSSVEKKFYGVASGMLGTMRLTGQMFSMGMTLLLFALYIGRVPITPQNYQLFLKSMKTAFTISAVLCFAGIFASVARGRTHGVSSNSVRNTTP
jgi:EmrB/QacA subfamily drug resistance transporter